MVFTAVNQAFNDYRDSLPCDIVSSVAKSAFYSFTISLIFSSRTPDGVLDLSRPLLKGGIAALASTIHALATPLFDQVFGKGNLNPFYEFVKSTVTAFTASALMGYAQASSSIQLSAFKLYYLISSNSFTAWTTNDQNHPYIRENSIYLCF